MLVHFHKGFIMEGEATDTVWRWFKKIEERTKIYLHTGISGFCDESEVEAEVERLTAERLKESGWGKDFSGWQRVLTYKESLEVAKNLEWDIKDLPKCELTITPLDKWTVLTAATKLTGKQFAQYCKDYGIPYYNK